MLSEHRVLLNNYHCGNLIAAASCQFFLKSDYDKRPPIQSIFLASLKQCLQDVIIAKKRLLPVQNILPTNYTTMTRDISYVMKKIKIIQNINYDKLYFVFNHSVLYEVKFHCEC